jgi:hypothetical protein
VIMLNQQGTHGPSLFWNRTIGPVPTEVSLLEDPLERAEIGGHGRLDSTGDQELHEPQRSASMEVGGIHEHGGVVGPLQDVADLAREGSELAADCELAIRLIVDDFEGFLAPGGNCSLLQVTRADPYGTVSYLLAWLWRSSTAEHSRTGSGKRTPQRAHG